MVMATALDNADNVHALVISPHAEFKHALEPTSLDSAYRVATLAAKIGIGGVRSPEEALIRIMHGRTLGITAMQALRFVYVVNGRPSVDSTLMRALCQSHPDREEFAPRKTAPLITTFRAIGWRARLGASGDALNHIHPCSSNVQMIRPSAGAATFSTLLRRAEQPVAGAWYLFDVHPDGGRPRPAPVGQLDPRSDVLLVASKSVRSRTRDPFPMEKLASALPNEHDPRPTFVRLNDVAVAADNDPSKPYPRRGIQETIPERVADGFGRCLICKDLDPSNTRIRGRLGGFDVMMSVVNRGAHDILTRCQGEVP